MASEQRLESGRVSRQKGEMFCKEPQEARLEDGRENGPEIYLEKWLEAHLGQ